MEFWKRNWEKIFADTVSGVLIRGIVGIIFLIVLVPKVVPKIVNQPMDNEIAKEIINLVYKISFCIYCLLLFFLPKILESRGEKRQDKIREMELENENLKLQLELRQQEQQSPPDETE